MGADSPRMAVEVTEGVTRWFNEYEIDVTRAQLPLSCVFVKQLLEPAFLRATKSERFRLVEAGTLLKPAVRFQKFLNVSSDNRTRK